MSAAPFCTHAEFLPIRKGSGANGGGEAYVVCLLIFGGQGCKLGKSTTCLLTESIADGTVLERSRGNPRPNPSRLRGVFHVSFVQSA